MRIVLLLPLVALAGCTPQLAFSNAVGGIIEERGNVGAEASFKLAQEHCARHGKLAEITGRDYLMNTTQFRCVDKS